MSLKSLITAVRYYTEFDPYFYTIDNRPIEDLALRDDNIADELDKRVQVVDITGHITTPIETYLPTGWTLTRNGVGDYTITHAKNSTSYIVTGVVVNSAAHILFVTSIAPDSFSIKTVTLAGAAADVKFNCLVSQY
jgi:D-serine dehydratase